jgi:Leucine-rich repeat (LRR) protein
MTNDMPSALRYFDASDNDLTGPIPDNFMINSAYLNQTVSVYLQNNEITGTLPSELIKFQFLDINLAGNGIEEIPNELCSIDGWMRGNVNKIGNCSAILCPQGTFNQFGHQSPGNPCLECSHLADVKYLGNTHCENFTSERDTLTMFFVDTGGEFWGNNTSWNTQAPICSWFGILCEDDSLQGTQGITSISLPSNGLSGTLPSEIWTLPSLQSITLDMNQDLVVELTGIANAADSLETLSLSHVAMTSLEGISAATNLRKISVIGNNIFGKNLVACAHFKSFILNTTYQVSFKKC